MLSFRFATQADIPAMLKIYTPYVLGTVVSFETSPPGEREFAARMAERQDKFPWLVCMQEDRLVGYAYAGRMGTRPGYDWSAETSIYLWENARGSGVGGQLYSTLISLLKAQGYRSLYALVATPNPESEAFHTKMGFEKEGLLRQVGFKFGQVVGVAYYAKNLLPFQPGMAKPALLSELEPALLQGILHQVGDKTK